MASQTKANDANLLCAGRNIGCLVSEIHDNVYSWVKSNETFTEYW